MEKNRAGACAPALAGSIWAVFSCQRKPCICATDLGALPYPPPPLPETSKKGADNWKTPARPGRIPDGNTKKEPGGTNSLGPFRVRLCGTMCPFCVGRRQAAIAVTLKTSSLLPTLATSKPCLEAPHNARLAVAFAFNVGNSPSMCPPSGGFYHCGKPLQIQGFQGLWESPACCRRKRQKDPR